LLKEGLIWRVGNGADIDIWTSNWIPRSTLQRPFGHKPNQEVRKVEGMLMPEGGGWNLQKLNEVFFENDVEDISKIPIGRAGSVDYIAWNYTKNGIFSVWSTYHLKQQIRVSQAGRAGPSLNYDDHQGWLSLWAADVPAKVKIHCWPLARNGLAVGEELRRRKIKEGVLCIACNRQETLLHRFWECPFSAQVWNSIRLGTGLSFDRPPHDLRSHGELQSWILDWFGKVRDKELEMGLLTLYNIWLARNEARDQPMIENPELTARRIGYLWEEWKNSKVVAPERKELRMERWLPPPPGWHKVNCDGACLRADGVGGGGAVLRDHHGDFQAGACHFLPSVADPERAELLACRLAASLARDRGVQKLILETDCSGIVTKLVSPDIDRSVHGPLVEDIKKLLQDFGEIKIQHVRRSVNEVAHRLAKEGCSNKLCNAWVGVPPDWVVNLLDTDCAVN
jgi:ribonuclease HI